jgi:hypothetical protein
MKRRQTSGSSPANQRKMKMVKMKMKYVKLVRFAKRKLNEPNMMGDWILNTLPLQP